MGEFANGLFSKIVTGLLSVVILVINIYFVATSIVGAVPQWWAPMLGVIVAVVIYFAFVAYLTVYLLICLGFEGLAQYSWVQACYNVEPFLLNQQPPVINEKTSTEL